jgi:hypothetical protein
VNAQDVIDAIMAAGDDGEGPDSVVVIVDKFGDPHPVKEVYWDDELESIAVEY